MNPMRRFTLGACAPLLALLLAVAPARTEQAETCVGRDLTHVDGVAAAEAKRADDLLNADGLFWRVDKAGLAPSYVFGAIHSTDESALEIARRAARQIEGAKVVVTELGGPLDLTEKANVGAAMLSKALDRDHDTFEGAIPPEDREPIEKLLARFGYPSEFAHHLKLWFLAVLTGMPSCEVRRQAGLPEVDQFLAQTAKDAGVKVVGLETAQEQLDAVANTPPEVAAAILALTAREPDLNDDVYATMLKLYRESRPTEILPITDVVGNLSDSERAAQDEFMRILLVGRNATMAERAAPLLADGGAFIAVGALHLSGKDGLIERFRAAGYTVTKAW
jgi:uncharacterized protein YbaP (TraB family)